MKGPTRIPFPSPCLPPAVSPTDKASVQRAIVAAAFTAAVLGFLAALLDLRSVREELADVHGRLVALEAAKAPDGGFTSVDDALREHARRVLGEVTP